MPTRDAGGARALYDGDADLGRLQARTIAIIGYGSQGRAHALNLRDSGLHVVVGLHQGSRSRARAESDAMTVISVSRAVDLADLVVMLTPDAGQGELFASEIAPGLNRGGRKTLLFAHGFSIRFGQVEPAAKVDVSLVSPKGPGSQVRELYMEGAGVPALVAVHQDPSGGAFEDALAYAKAIGCTRAGVLQTTFAEETETDLFGEQAVLCGGVPALVRAAFETLVEAGYQPEVAYFECLHELKLIVDLVHAGGLNYMRHVVSDTAEYGEYVAGPRIVTEATRSAMRELLMRVRDGSFARAWIEETRRGRPHFERMRAEAATHVMEVVGLRVRRMMPFIDAREPMPGQRESPSARGP